MTQTAWRVEEKKTQSTSTDHRLKGLTLKHKNLFGVLSNILRQTCCEHLASTLSIINRLHLHPVFCEPFASHIFPLCHFSAEPLGHLSYSSTKPTFVFFPGFQVETNSAVSSSVWTGPGSLWRRSTTWWMRRTNTWMWCSDAEATSGRRLSLVSLCVPVSLLWQNREATTITRGGTKGLAGNNWNHSGEMHWRSSRWCDDSGQVWTVNRKSKILTKRSLTIQKSYFNCFYWQKMC